MGISVTCFCGLVCYGMRILFPKEVSTVSTIQTTLFIPIRVNTLSCTVVYHVHLNLVQEPLAAHRSGYHCVFTIKFCVCQAKSLSQQMEQEIKKRTQLQTELMSLQQSNYQLRSSEKQLTQVSCSVVIYTDWMQCR